MQMRNDYLLIDPVEAATVSKGGVILPNAPKTTVGTGHVISGCDEKYAENAQVIYDLHGVVEVEDGHIVKKENVYAVL